MKWSLLFVLATAVPSFAIDGTVHNATKDKPQPAATVSLFRITQNGPEMLTSVKSISDGSFNIQPPAGSDTPGPKLLQAAYGGVTYNKMIPPGSPTQNLQIDVFESSAKAGDSKVTTHMMLLEPVNGQVQVSESYVWTNTGKVTYSDPDRGTLRIYLPPETQGKAEVNVVAPNSVAIRRSADPTNEPNVFKIDFPVKPGESRVDVTYKMPFTTPAKFTDKWLFPNPNTKLLAPLGVTFSGAGLSQVGQEPTTKATIYNFDGPALAMDVQGTGTLPRGDAAAASDANSGGDSDDQIAELLPQLYGKVSPVDGFLGALNSVKWILTLAVGMLALGFVYLYRKPTSKTS
jgi:hypothetical protein